MSSPPPRRDAAYHRAWRAAHPEYRARQNCLRNERRRLHGRGDRSTEYAARRSRAIPPLPGLHVGHALFEQARQVVGPRTTTLLNLADPLYDDLVAEATLALVEGADPVAAVRRYRAREAAFGRVTCPLLEEAA
jgi:hypothetical protein